MGASLKIALRSFDAYLTGRHTEQAKAKFDPRVPKGPSRTKNTTDSKFTIRSKFATAIVKYYGGHCETTIFKGN